MRISVARLLALRSRQSVPFQHPCSPPLPTSSGLAAGQNRPFAHTTPLQRPPDSPSTSRPVANASDISHSDFISSSSPSADFNPTQTPHAGLSSASPWQGKLSPTSSHLFKLILPLPSPGTWPSYHQGKGKGKDPTPQPTAFLLHPSQPLSHLSRLISGSLPPSQRNAEITYLALTGQETDLDTHLRNAEEEEKRLESDATHDPARMEGGPFLGERDDSEGRWQEVSWSQSTDLSDFIKQSCLNEQFKIVIEPEIKDDEAEAESKRQEGRMTLEVVIPSFKSRTTYLRQRLLKLTKELDGMTRKKKHIDAEAHKGAQRLAVTGLTVGAAYWVAVIRWTFFTDAGWDLMEPVTWSVGFGSLLASVAFLAYHNREVSYSSLLDLSVSARQAKLYDQHGLDVEKWTEMVAEAKTIRREITRIAADYDIEWKGELENLADRHGQSLATRKGYSVSPSAPSSQAAKEEEGGSGEDVKDGRGKVIDIDKTIDEASELAESSDESRRKEKASQRKGEGAPDEGDARGRGGKREREMEASEDRGRAKGEELARRKTE